MRENDYHSSGKEQLDRIGRATRAFQEIGRQDRAENRQALPSERGSVKERHDRANRMEGISEQKRQE